MSPQVLRIGSRGSALALVQAGLVSSALSRLGVDSLISVITTDGDVRATDTPWGEGAFVTAIEAALLAGRVDVAVHSAKDVPTDEDPRTLIAAYLPRAAAGDVLVLPTGSAPIASVRDLPPNARVGTDSPRRTAFLRAARPDLTFHGLHGNVDTRLRRLDSGESDVLVLAEAGLDRLGRTERISLRLEPTVLPPAPGQGALAVQVRAADAMSRAAVASLDDPDTRRAVEAERALLAATGGGCRAPIGAFARPSANGLRILSGYAREDGAVRVMVELETPPPRPKLANARDADEALVLAALDRLAADGAEAARRTNGPPVIVTRATSQSSALVLSLVDRGMAPLAVPAIEIVPGDLDAMNDAVAHMGTFDWLVVTSVNTVEALRSAARRNGASLASLAAGPRWAAVGIATKRALIRSGVPVALVPEHASASALVDALPIDAGARVLFPRSDIADAAPIDRLVDRGAVVEAPVAYRTLEAPGSSVALLRAALELRPVATVLTSGSTARGLVALAEQLGAGARMLAIPAICIGPDAARHAEALGYRVGASGPTQRVGGIADLVARFVAQSELQPLPLEVAR